MLEESFEHVADTAGPATVQITVTIESRQDPSIFADSDSPSFFGDNIRSSPRIVGKDYGSGIIIRPDGYILTNDHVVEQAMGGKVLVTLSDKRTFWGTVVRDNESDLAVVKIDAGHPLPYVTLGAARAPRVGQWAIAIGSPLNEQNVVTAGIVSAIHRSQSIGSDGGGATRFYPDLIETDTPINFGNSGGPLLNIDGELIGINVAMIARGGGAGSTLGFAIPVNVAKMVSDQLIANGKVTRSSLGVIPTGIPGFLRKQLGRDKGAYITQVNLNTAADRAGIQPGDIVTRFGNDDIDDDSSLRFAINTATPHTIVPITLFRDGQMQTVSATLDSSERQSYSVLAALAEPIGGGSSPKVTANDLGLRLRAVTPSYSALYDIHPALHGVVVASVSRGSAAFEAELESNCVITAINGNPITTTESVEIALATSKPHDVVAFSVYLPGYTGRPASRAVVNIEVP